MMTEPGSNAGVKHDIFYTICYDIGLVREKKPATASSAIQQAS